jgi:glycosyltransferase involved in cell wall biosynthesis
VSDVTARECEQLLDRRPDVVTPNGFQGDLAPLRLRAKRARRSARETLLHVAHALTGKTFADDTFIVATSGRCEYRNKGIDVFLDAMKQLEHGSRDREILAFVLVPAWVKEPRADLLERMQATDVAPTSLYEPFITHNVNNPYDDVILNRIRQHGVGADDASNVHVIYIPCYLNGNDGILNLDYYDVLVGLDATAFPSYYEPWGYTPLESVAFGVPTVTTNLSGFGQWVLATSVGSFAESGVMVIPRNDSNYQDVVNSLADGIKLLVDDKDGVCALASKAARSTASKAEWDLFIQWYNEAYQQALDAADSRRVLPSSSAD